MYVRKELDTEKEENYKGTVVKPLKDMTIERRRHIIRTLLMSDLLLIYENIILFNKK